jgi:hypothetical protein
MTLSAGKINADTEKQQMVDTVRSIFAAVARATWRSSIPSLTGTSRRQPVFHHSNLSDTAPIMRGRAWKCAISRRADLALNVIQKMFVLKFREALFGTHIG